MKKAIINTTIYDFEKVLPNAYVVFDEKVEAVGEMRSFTNEGYTLIDGEGHLTMPTFVVGHTHVYSTFARGLNVAFNPRTFRDILEQLWWRLDRHLDNETNYHSGIVSAVDFAKNGVTTLIDHHASGVDIEGSLSALKSAICDDAKLRGAFAFETSDRFDVGEALAENEQFIDEHATSFCRGLFGLHASLSLSEETLKAVKQRLGNAPIHMHVAESEEDQEDCQRQYGERVVERLARHGLLTPGSILTHAVHVDRHEIELMKRHGVVVAVCPNSNMNNAVGLPDVKRFLDEGVRVILGNDGISTSIASECLALLYSMHHRYASPTAFTLDDVKTILDETFRYAGETFGVKLGRMSPAYEADLQLLPYVAPTPFHADTAFGHLFFGAFHSFKPRHVFCGGRHIVKDYEVDGALRARYDKAQSFARRLWDNIHEEDAL